MATAIVESGSTAGASSSSSSSSESSSERNLRLQWDQLQLLLTYDDCEKVKELVADEDHDWLRTFSRCSSSGEPLPVHSIFEVMADSTALIPTCWSKSNVRQHIREVESLARQSTDGSDPEDRIAEQMHVTLDQLGYTMDDWGSDLGSIYRSVIQAFSKENIKARSRGHETSPLLHSQATGWLKQMVRLIDETPYAKEASRIRRCIDDRDSKHSLSWAQRRGSETYYAMYVLDKIRMLRTKSGLEQHLPAEWSVLSEKITAKKDDCSLEKFGEKYKLLPGQEDEDDDEEVERDEAVNEALDEDVGKSKETIVGRMSKKVANALSS